MTKEKYALLDTDFISKTHLIHKDENNRLLDRILEMSGYRFYCHEQIKVEIDRHNIGNASVWLKEKISSGAIRCLNDDDIVDELRSIYYGSAETMYANMLRNGCDAYRTGYFKESFKRLQDLDYSATSKKSFLQELKKDSDEIGAGKNLGELKSYVLLQMLRSKLGGQIYVFCSDDRNARNGIVSLGGAKCISVLSSFMHLAIEGNMSKEEAKPYIESYLEAMRKSKQTEFRVITNSKENIFCKVPCKQVIEEMYSGKFEVLNDGNLKYKE